MLDELDGGHQGDEEQRELDAVLDAGHGPLGDADGEEAVEGLAQEQRPMRPSEMTFETTSTQRERVRSLTRSAMVEAANPAMTMIEM